MQILPAKYPSEIGLIGHTIINYPNRAEAMKIVDVLVANQVDLIELQIPFSEPIADGPIFAKANQDVIDQGLSLQECYEFMAELTAKYDIPFVFMTYANVVFKQGYDHFIKSAKKAGAKGAIVPDLPLDIAEDYYEACCKHNFAPISVVSPNITPKRLAKIAPYFDGFLYAVARAGVTGPKTSFDSELTRYLDELREFTQLPIAVGFGVAQGADVEFLRGKADYAVIGTQTIRSYQEQGIVGVQQLWQELGLAGRGRQHGS